MDTNLLSKVQNQYLKQSLPKVETGDMVSVTSAIRDKDGKKIRTQIFRGLILAIKGSGISQNITVRKISNGVGVEKIFPIHSPNVESIEIERKGKVRRSKIYYMRDRIGKKAMKVPESTKEIEMLEYKEKEVAKEDVVSEKVEDGEKEASVVESIEEEKVEQKEEEKKEVESKEEEGK
jgi:large subunit ribosomal protein L19